MKKLTCVLAILAAASTAALAKDIKQNKKATTKAPAVSAHQMNDADMDKVTAGVSPGASGVQIFAPNNLTGTPGQGRSPVCFNTCGAP
jgi:hypothetical protein